MRRTRDALQTAGHWHVDCRLEAELPEDRIVGTRFLVSTLFGCMAVVTLLLAGWLGYTRATLRQEVEGWEHSIAEFKGQVEDVWKMQDEYSAEAAKIASASNLVGTKLSLSTVIENLGNRLPMNIGLTSIDWDGNVILVRGTVPSSTALTNYVTTLRKDPYFSSVFPDIKQTDFAPMRDSELFTFEITFRQPTAP